jgi:hypothetical protein
LIRFAAILGGVTLLVVGLTGLASWQHWIEHFPSFFYETLILLLFSTLTISAYLHRLLRPDFFVQLYLLTMAVKFLAFGAYNAVMILMDETGAVANVIFFLLIYVLFTALEIAFLYRKVSRTESPQKASKNF